MAAYLTDITSISNTRSVFGSIFQELLPEKNLLLDSKKIGHCNIDSTEGIKADTLVNQ